MTARATIASRRGHTSSRSPVGWSADLERIVALPRRLAPDVATITSYLHARLRLPTGKQSLRPLQAQALFEAPVAGGLLAPIQAGGGKTLVGCLMPLVMPGCRRAVLFLPAHLRAQFLEHDWPAYSQHWRMPNLAGGRYFTPGLPVLTVLSYSELSSPRATAILDDAGGLAPDLVICDEVHHLRHRDTARGRRFLRYFAAHPKTRFCGWSGTLTDYSIRDYAHLSAVALSAGSPLPLHPPTVEEWAAALDPGDAMAPAGRLLALCEAGEDVRSGFRRRLVSTLGVVASAESTVGASLTFQQRRAPAIPANVALALAGVRQRWVRPDGEELVDGLSTASCTQQLANGFYYRWRFPHGEPEALIEEWFQARQAWNRELRVVLRNARPHFDSPKLCVMAAVRYYRGGCASCDRAPEAHHARGCPLAESQPVWAAKMWRAWDAIRGRVYHEQEAVWLSDYLLEDAARWALDEPGIVWVMHSEVGYRLSALTGLPYYGGGEAASRGILDEKGTRSIVASIRAHSEGKNLQRAFGRNLVVTPPSSGKVLEQAVARTHRPGQLRDEVEVHYYAHTPELQEALRTARERARYVEETTGAAQRLVYGTWLEGMSPSR